MDVNSTHWIWGNIFCTPGTRYFFKATLALNRGHKWQLLKKFGASGDLVEWGHYHCAIAFLAVTLTIRDIPGSVF